jgi:hypothetical protein
MEWAFELLVREADALEWPDRPGSAARIEIDGEALQRVFAPRNLYNYLLPLRSSRMYQIAG